jgi:dTDP-4-dehydrorhamnose 3,5-epimerase
MSLAIHETFISGVFLIENIHVTDSRGQFSRFFCKEELSPVLEGKEIKQVNHSCTKSVGAIRGLHYQSPPCAEMKFMRCLKGKVWDVVVDLRVDSPTFLEWYSEELDPSSNLTIVIPEGCAHGFQVLHADSELLYMHTEFYSPEHEGGLRYDDPKLKISWPLQPVDISERDLVHPLINSDFLGIKI